MFIRDEKSGDAARITDIQYAAFKDHPLHPAGAEPTEHLIVERLRAAGALTLSLLAGADGAAVGHIALSPAAVGADATQIPAREPLALAMGRKRLLSS